jgi:MarR family 2-MHQ and catechol resistance regulon transcriptional repressor
LTNSILFGIILILKDLAKGFGMPTHYKGTKAEILALDALIKLTRAAESLELRLNRSGTRQNLTVTQFGVLEALYHLGPMTLCEVGRKVLKSNGNITLVVDNLEKLGLVRRERSLEDRRVVNLTITSPGRELIEKIIPEHVAAVVSEMSVLTPEEQVTLAYLSKKLGKKPDLA